MLNLKFTRHRWFHILLASVVAITIALGQPTLSHAFRLGDLIGPVFQSIQLGNLSDQQEMEFGKQINSDIVRQVKISTNTEVIRYVNEIGQRLAAQSDRPRITYTFQVVDDDGINAFATMGGWVYVNKGLLKAADNEAQLASVMGHEIGHITGKHAIRQMRTDLTRQGIMNAAGLKSAIAKIGVELALRRPRSRRDEYDADRRGLVNLGNAGYAQSEAVAFMQKLVKGGSPPTILNTHPNASDRVTEMQKQIRSQPSAANGGLDGTTYKNRLQAMRI
jgi:beta-barrel assembly-enhancing protease